MFTIFSAFFTTKTGLHQSLQQLHWYSPFPVSSFFPRCYQVSISIKNSMYNALPTWMVQCIEPNCQACNYFIQVQLQGLLGRESWGEGVTRILTNFQLLSFWIVHCMNMSFQSACFGKWFTTRFTFVIFVTFMNCIIVFL